MQLVLLAMVFALAGGVAAGFQGPLASLMSRSIGNLGSNFYCSSGRSFGNQHYFAFSTGKQIK